MDKHRGSWAAVLLFAMVAGGCGVPDDGGWDPVSGPLPSPSPTPISIEEPGPPEPGSPIIEGSVHANRQNWVRCELAPEMNVRIELTNKVPFYTDAQSRVCMGEEGQVEPTFCHQVHAFEARALSVARCYEVMWNLMAEKAEHVLGQHWMPKTLPLLPDLWSKTPAEISSMSHRLSAGMITLLTNGTRQEAAGAPLCYPTNGLKPELASLLALKGTYDLVEGTRAQLEKVTSALSRGINVQVDKDLSIQMSAYFVELPHSNVTSTECTFQLPPSL